VILRSERSIGSDRTIPHSRAHRVDAALAAYDELHERLVAVHTPDVVDMSLSLAQLKVIYVAAAAGPLTMGALAERLGTTLSTTSGAVDRLVRKGLLARSEAPGDRRQVLVEPTPTALEQIERMSELGRARLRAMLEAMRPTEIETVERAIRLLAGAVVNLNEENR
jgi:DNA-binding MarR family transcriptional regulator